MVDLNGIREDCLHESKIQQSSRKRLLGWHGLSCFDGSKYRKCETVGVVGLSYSVMRFPQV